MARFLARVIIASAEQSQKYPDTCYFRMTDVDTGQGFQASTRRLNAVDIGAIKGQIVTIDGNLLVQQSKGGLGYNLIFEDLKFAKDAPVTNGGVK